MNGHCDLFLNELNQFMTISEFFHWFKLKRSTKYLFSFFETNLLILPSSDWDGFSNRQGVLVQKFILRYFSVFNAGFWAVHSILLSNLILFAICIASKLIVSSKRGVPFLYVLVIFSFNKLLHSLRESSYMFVVLSAGINVLGEAFSFAISVFIKCWNLLYVSEFDGFCYI